MYVEPVNITTGLQESGSFNLTAEDQTEQPDLSFVICVMAGLAGVLASKVCNCFMQRVQKKTEYLAELCRVARQREPDLSRAEQLLKKGAGILINEKIDSLSPLHWAAGMGSPEMIDFLIRAGARIENRSNEGSLTPFLTAVREGHIPGIEKLSELGADCKALGGNSNEYNAINIACIFSTESRWDLEKCRGVIRALVAAGVSLEENSPQLNTDGLPLVTFGASVGSPEMLEVLIEQGAEFGKNRFAPLASAIAAKRIENVRKIAEFSKARNFDFAEIQKEVFSWMGRNHYTKEEAHTVFAILAENGFDITALGQYCEEPILFYGVFHGTQGIVEALVDLGAEVNPVNKNGHSPIFLAVVRCKLEVFEYLFAQEEVHKNEDQVRKLTELVLKLFLNNMEVALLEEELNNLLTIKIRNLFSRPSPGPELEEMKEYKKMLAVIARGSPENPNLTEVQLVAQIRAWKDQYIEQEEA